MTNSTPSTHAWWPPLAAATIAAVLFGGCGALDKKPVCGGTPHHLVVIASTSKSDLAVSQQMAPVVIKQAVDRAVRSCGSLSVGLFGGQHAEADLALHTREFTPSKTSTYGSVTPILKPLEDDGATFVKNNLLKPLAKAEAVDGSPFLNGLARVSAELNAHHITGATVLMIGDGIAIEYAQDGSRIDLSAKTIDVKAVNAFASLYEPLKNSCVILTGSGAAADLTDEQLRTARNLLDGVLKKAGAHFVPTRDDDIIPWDC